MDPRLLEIAIVDMMRMTGHVPMAIIPIHPYEMPAKMVQILEVAVRFGIPVLEDTAEALGSRYKGAFLRNFWGVCGCLFMSGLYLPSHPGLSDEDIERVVKVIKSLARD